MRLLATALLLLTAGTSHADRGELTEQTPYTLEPGEVRVGLSDTSMGLFGHELLRRLEIGTRPIAWIPSIAGLPSYDVHAKLEIWRDRTLSLAIAAEHLRVDLAPLLAGDEPAMEEEAAARGELAFTVTPIEGWAGLRLGKRVRLNTGAIYTKVAVRGRTPGGPIDELGGAVGTSNVQLRGNVAIKLTRTIHLVLGGRFLPWQAQYAEATVSEEVGEDGEVSNTTRGEADLMDVSGKAWSLGGEVHLTWRHTNLRLGVEYGNYTVPIVNFVAERRGWLPVVDLYWRI